MRDYIKFAYETTDRISAKSVTERARFYFDTARSYRRDGISESVARPRIIKALEAHKALKKQKEKARREPVKSGPKMFVPHSCRLDRQVNAALHAVRKAHEDGLDGMRDAVYDDY